MIIEKYKLILIHIEKTGGTSLFNSLFPDKTIHAEGHQFPDKHFDLRHYIGQVDKDDYFKTSFVRNPFDRAVSKCFHYKKLAATGQNPQNDNLTQLAFSDWVKQGGLDDLSPQMEYLVDHDHEFAMDFVGRFENLQEDWDKVCDRIKIPRKTLGHYNATEHKHYSEYYDTEAREIITEKYATDLLQFKYEFNTRSV
jgi:chondroitin 4-sulfotransferase 11